MPELRKKTILLMRHAKSSWDHPHLRDFERPLNSRGKKDAPRMGIYLKELNMTPGRIISSPAARAKATIKHVVQSLGISENGIEWDESLYFTSAESYVNAIRLTDDSIKIVMTVGHNPMTADVIELLAEDPVYRHIPTATIACLQTELDSWANLKHGSCKVKWIVAPKEIG